MDGIIFKILFSSWKTEDIMEILSNLPKRITPIGFWLLDSNGQYFESPTFYYKNCLSLEDLYVLSSSKDMEMKHLSEKIPHLQLS